MKRTINIELANELAKYTKYIGTSYIKSTLHKKISS